MTTAKEKTNRLLAELEELVQTTENIFDYLQAGGDITQLLVAYYRFKSFYDDLDAIRKRFYAIKDRIDKHIAPEALEQSGMDKVSIPEVERTFYIIDRYSASIIDKPAAFKWLRENGASELIQETVNAGTLASYLKSLVLEEGKDPPEDLFKFTPYRTTGIAKYRPKKG